jgi:hypothetical protein
MELRSVSVRFAVIGLVVLCALFGMTPRAQAATPKQVLVLGDSIVGGASNYIGFYMGSDGKAQTTFRSVGGLALCDLLPGAGGPWTINSILSAKRYDAIVVAFSGNSSTKCMGNQPPSQVVVDKYRADVQIFMGITRQYAVPTVVWAKPPAAAGAALDGVRSRLGQVYGELPASWPTARVIDGGVRVEDAAGRFARHLPCEPWDKPGCYAGWVPIGDADGIHFYCARRGIAYYGVVPPCDTYSAGSNRYGMNLAATRSFIGLP